LNFASRVLLRASATLHQMTENADTIDLVPIQVLAKELPWLFGVSDLTKLQDPLYVDTDAMIACGKAMREVFGDEKSSVTGILLRLENIRLQFEAVGQGSVIDPVFLSQGGEFCLALARQLIDQVPMPEPGDRALRFCA